jgi:hypothetical protein
MSTEIYTGRHKLSDQIAELSEQVSLELDNAVSNIEDIDSRTRIVSLNAKIEATRAGEIGRAFSIVADEIERLSKNTANIAIKMKKNTQQPINKLLEISKQLKTNVVGTRLSDLALVNIELVDRNLYERSCDVRWWATDDSLTKALELNTPEALRYASKRLGIILNSYTVYYDLVLCDLEGNVVANGRPATYISLGMNQRNEEWFKSAMETKSGDEYGFQSAHISDLVNEQHALVYSCCVRKNGEVNGDPIGVLGIVFNWTELSQNIVKNTPIDDSQWPTTRVCLFTEEGFILADSRDNQLTEHLEFSYKTRENIFGRNRGYCIDKYEGKESLFAYAYSPGYETYSTGWYSVIIQEL